jgi:GNAT superfamily N-acetyltransferase
MEILPLNKCPQFVPILAHWAYLYWYVNRNVKFATVEADYRRRADFSALPVSWVALDRGFPIGMVSLKEFDLQSHRHLSPWLSALYVIPQFRRRGFAELLINDVIRHAELIGHEHVHLFTDNRNATYLSGYYESRGWNLIEKTYDNDGLYTEIFRIDMMPANLKK